jgi:hypothetical protein
MDNSLFKKIIWAQIIIILCFIVVAIPLSIFPPSFLLTNYSEFQSQIYLGALNNLGPKFELTVLLFLVVLYFISYFLLLRFHRAGPLIYFISIILGLLISIFSGDEVSYGIFSPIQWSANALEGLTLYLIFFTPLKNEFGNPQNKTI